MIDYSNIPVAWAMCSCYVWPVIAFMGWGYCGRCGAHPDLLYSVESKEEALDIYFENYHKMPDPI
jgi:hypothetical protein